MYPGVSLADARTKRDDAKKLMAEGVDPSVQKKLDRIAAETAARNTFGLVAEEYVETSSNGAADATLTKNKWLLKTSPRRSPTDRSPRSPPPKFWIS